jgi:hypothetical protein
MKFPFLAIIALLFGIATLSACERTPAEKMALLHSEQQSQINLANFERATQLREMKEDKEDAGQDSAD